MSAEDNGMAQGNPKEETPVGLKGTQSRIGIGQNALGNISSRI
jgi:hypothetical protein